MDSLASTDAPDWLESLRVVRERLSLRRLREIYPVALTCPTCGKPVLLIFWEWPANALVSAEYHHVTDAERDRQGLPPEPHTSFYSYERARELRFGENVKENAILHRQDIS